MYKDQLLMSWVYIANVCVCLAFGMILSLLVESPALNLDKMLMNLITGINKDVTSGKKDDNVIEMNGIYHEALHYGTLTK